MEALPDTLELLLRACMEALNLAGERAKREASAAAAAAATAPPSSNNGFQNPSSNPAAAAAAVVSELELARAVMSDGVYLAQLAPECFHEVVARVARKAEPERYALLFPLHLVGGDGDGGHGDAAREEAGEQVRGGGAGAGAGGGGVGIGPRWGRWVHPTHLFHECVSAGKLTTAAWYLPLIRDDVAYDAARR